MLKRYSGFGSSEQITIAELFNWELWPTILKIFGKEEMKCDVFTYIIMANKYSNCATIISLVPPDK